MSDEFLQLVDSWYASVQYTPPAKGVNDYEYACWWFRECLTIWDLDQELAPAEVLPFNNGSIYGEFIRLGFHKEPLREQVEFFIGLVNGG